VSLSADLSSTTVLDKVRDDLTAARRSRRETIFVVLSLTHRDVKRYLDAWRKSHPRNSNCTARVSMNSRLALISFKPSAGIHHATWATAANSLGTPVIGIGGEDWADIILRSVGPSFWGDDLGTLLFATTDRTPSLPRELQ
jgi:hypothetical protein